MPMKRVDAFAPTGISVADAIDAMENAGLQLPLLAKPQLQSRPGSHDLALIRDLPGLQSLVSLCLYYIELAVIVS